MRVMLTVVDFNFTIICDCPFLGPASFILTVCIAPVQAPDLISGIVGEIFAFSPKAYPTVESLVLMI